MSCFFCGSYYHSSQHCNNCVSDEERKRIALSKNCCWNCLAAINGKEIFNKYASLSNKQRCSKCDLNAKCYGCFTRNHHTVYCPGRFTISPTALFLPNINKDLFQRYMDCLNLQEQFSLKCSLPEAFSSIKLKLLQKANVHSNDVSFRDSVVSIDFTKAIFVPYKIEITNSFFSTAEFLQLLSFRTKVIQCFCANLTTDLELVEILKKAPNISIIDLWKINITIANSWPNDLMKWKHGSDLEYIKIAINELSFDIEAVLQLIKTKSINTSQFILFVDTNDSALVYDKKYNEFSFELLKYFYKVEETSNDKALVTVVTSNGIEKYHCL